MMSQEIITATSKIDLQQIQRKKVYVAIFGHGQVGSRLIDQIIAEKQTISQRRNLDITIFAIANSTSVWIQKEGIGTHWRTEKERLGQPYPISEIVNFVKEQKMEYVIGIDNTASSVFVENYPLLVRSGFHLVSSNKIANTLSLSFYRSLRKELERYKKEYLYETNVGAGLPLIDTIKLLHLSGENITRIKGVFSGSLSYLFNRFSEEHVPFSDVLRQAIAKGYTEPDPREDLCGNDVARKLLILARELDLHNELKDVTVQNLIPKELRKISSESFLAQLSNLDVPFGIRKKNLKPNEVLRYVGDLHGHLSLEDGARLVVKLEKVAKNSVLGQLQGSDSLFEIYTENYGKHPIVIQGAGAGAEVTARGVFGDILRLSEKLN